MRGEPDATSGKGGQDAGAKAGEREDFAGRGLRRWTAGVRRRKWLLVIVLVLQAIVFSALSAWIVWQADVLQFFSADSAEVRNLEAAAQKPGLANQLRLDVHFSSPPSATEKADVAATTRDLAGLLRGTGQFRSVWTGADDFKLAAAYAKLVNQAPLLLTADERAQVEARMTPEFLRRRFADARARLADPDGEILLRQLAGDPLDMASLIASRLKALAPGGGETASLQDGVLMTRDTGGRWHGMIVSEPVSLPSNQKAAEMTLAATNAAVAQAIGRHPGAAVWVVGAHRGYVENARRVMTDVQWVSVLGTLAVGLAIALYFRRLWPALLCMLPPMVGVGMALGFAGLFHVSLPLLLLGFAGLLCGSTTDYGIQLIAECRRIVAAMEGIWDWDIPAQASRRLLGPISMSVATSVTGFAALSLSASPGLRALGLFVAGATVCIWIVTFLVLPACLGPWILPKHVPPSGWDSRSASPAWRKRLFVSGGLAFAAVTVWLAVGAFHVGFNSDPRSLDGSPASLLADENAFSKVWGDPRNHALVLVSASTAGEALQRLTHVHDYLQDQRRDGLIAGVTSPAAILPDQATVQRRAAAWKQFWTPQRQANFKSALAAAATANDFVPAGFTSYVDRLANLVPPPAKLRLAESPAALFPGFVEEGNGGVTLASVVRMRADVPLRREAAWAPELRARYPGTVILGGKLLFFDALERARAEGERLLPWCLLAILLPLIVYFRRWSRAWLAMACLGVGLVWVLGVAEYFGGCLNLLALVPVLFTLGVAVDYGIYVLSAQRRAIGANVENEAARWSRTGATAMCALTTILGSGSLMLAGHPAMRWLGMTLAAGVTGGILAAVFLVGPVGRWMTGTARKHKLRGGWRVLRAARKITVTIVLAALTLLLLAPVVGEALLAREQPAGAEKPRVYPPLVQTGRRSFAVGDSWMRWRATGEGGKSEERGGMWEIKLVGDPFARGHAVGALASPLDFRIEAEMLGQLDSFLPDEWARWVVLRGVGLNMLSLPKYVPLEYRQEIWASAEGGNDPDRYLAPSYPRILSYHALHDISQMLIDNPLIVPNSFACTGVVSLPGYTGGSHGHLWLARNFDFEGGESFGRQKSVTFVVPPPGEGMAFVHIAWPGLAGCVTGMNSDHIAVFLNAAATSDHRRIGTPTIFMARDILQHAHSVDDAEKIIRGTQVFVSDIITVADGKTGAARVFEKSPARMDSYDVQGSTVVTNHLVTPRFAGDPVNRQRLTDSTTFQRWRRARELLDAMKGDVTAEHLVALVRDKKAVGGKDIGLGNRNAIDGLIACHSVVMDVTAGRLWVGAWPNAEGAFLCFDLSREIAAAPGGPLTDEIPAAPIMTDGGWQRVQESRMAQNDALNALRRGSLDQAQISAKRAVELNAQFYFGHELLGRALLRAGKNAAAKQEFQRALQLDPPYKKRRDELQKLVRDCSPG